MNIITMKKLSQLEGLIAIGDAFANFNPIYGQVIKLLLLLLFVLDKMLWEEKKDSKNFTQRFQQELSYKITVPYILAASSDMRFPKTTGGGKGLNWALPVIDRAFTKMLYAGSKNKYVHRNFLNVLHMTEGFLWRFFDPVFVWNIIFP